MTISTTQNSVVIGGNGATTSFAFPFVGVAAGDISVIYTDANGNETTLAPSQYSITFNPLSAGQLWQVGGTVTYPLSGSPIAVGTTLTIQRTLPLTQTSSISNQGDFYPQVVEQALDTLCMEIQQVSAAAARAIQVPVVDANTPAPLPPAAERANLALIFDANGNPIVGGTPTVAVSSAMAPVVQASTLNAGRIALGAGSIGNPLFQASTIASAVATLNIPLISTSIAGLQSYTSTAEPGGYVQITGYYAQGDGGGGLYWYDSSDTTSADNGGTIIVDASGRRWKLWHLGAVSLLQFGVKGDNVTDDKARFQAAITWAEGAASLGNAASAALYMPPGYQILIKSGLVINSPIVTDIQSPINYDATTGTALTIGGSAPTRGNQGYGLHFFGFYQVTGQNTNTPASINTSGASAIQINSLAFSRLRVDVIDGFTYFGVYLDGLGDVFSPQVIQHNTFDFGQIVNCGLGIVMNSASAATSSAEANTFFIQNAYQCFTCIRLDDSSHTASTSNTFFIESLDNSSASGFGVECWGYYNYFYIGYTGTSVNMETAKYNTVKIVNNFSTSAVVAYGNNDNWVVTGQPDITQLPNYSFSVALGTVYQNTFGVPVQVSVSANITPTSSSSETVNVAVGKTNSPTAITQCAVASMASPVAYVFPLIFTVPAGWYWELTAAGSGSVSVSAAAILPIGNA